MKKVSFNDFSSPETMHNPIIFYKQLMAQEEAIFHLDDFYGMGGALVTLGYDDAVMILKDSRFIKDVRNFLPQKEKKEASEETTTVDKLFEWMMNMPNLLTVDPPDHTRLRRLVSKAFSPRMIENLRPRIQQITNELLDNVKEKGKMDVIADFANPLPIIVISEMLGIPTENQQQFREWTHTLMSAALDPRQVATVTNTLDQFIHYIEVLLDEKRISPCDDLMSALIQAQEQEDKLSKNELLSTIWLLFIAGHETTVNLIGNGMLALLQHPEQMKMLRDNPSLLPSAIEELLRYAGPIMIAHRFASEDVVMHGKTIKKGEMVLFSLAAANIDPRKFENPETLNITREENNHLAFGSGIHHCLGAPLARLEGEIAFGTLLQRFPNLDLAIEPEKLIYNYSKFRSLASLPVTF
ncbi:cytochrome P450 family protein [Priestia taiwanensis]|uniref:Polyketide biosynthesis cytochrome P450 PksS n=1 Tax=Priestia taiwanensis TaxID=1347902 RepID=A0A917AJ78_9BACI|nr:cytochrome P450 [Priestia taiwanensis]MBM7361545.1 cytochrome P450 PksS [Priestia taiwanensis]GGE55038.1 polyketide biosynthesis cytochrome P450 PksS [Priestia taiwanensis]